MISTNHGSAGLSISKPSSHLRVEETCIRFHNAYGLIEGLYSVECACTVTQNSSKVQPQILRMKLSRKAVA